MTAKELAVVEAARRRVEEGHDAFCAVFVEHAGMPCNCGHDALAAALRDLDAPCEMCGGQHGPGAPVPCPTCQGGAK